MVSIHRSQLVVPSEPTPSSTLSVSLCDQIKLPNHGSQLYLYTNTTITHHPLFHILSLSLSKALTHYYPFAGRLRRLHGGRFQLLCNARGAVLIEATSSTEFTFNFRDFSPVHAVPKINYDDVPIEDVPLLVAQITRFPNGFITLGVSLCRAVLDGNSASSFVNSWAKLARGESLDSSLIPFLDRTKLDSFKLNKPPRFEHPEFFPPPLLTQQHTQIKEQLGSTILDLTKGQVEKLKKKASDFGSGYGINNGNGSVRPYTSFEVISGHLWRCVCKVRYAGGDLGQPTRFTTLVNCRNRLRPSLPTAYFGNATFPTVTPTCSFDEIMHKPLGYAVGKVREAIEKMSDEYVRSALDYIASVEDFDSFRDMFYGSGDGKGKFKGDPNLYMVGWTNFKYFETDFGWGKPVSLLPGNINSNGKAFLLDNASGDGFIVAVCLLESHVDALRKLFYEDIENASSKL